MPALIRDLAIVQREDGPWLEFTWQGRTDEWRVALDAVKSSIPSEAREYDADAQVWRVAGVFEETLADIFPNFAGALDGMRSQLGLFEEAMP
jgi:hypothetical protein